MALLRNPALRPWRALGLAYPILLVVLLVLGAKPHYAAPLLLCLLAPGAVVVERWAHSSARNVLVGTAIVLNGAFAIPLALPVVPASTLHSTPIPDVNEDAIETVGWPELVRSVARVYEGLPASQRESAVIFTGTTARRERSIASVPRTDSRVRSRDTTPTRGSGCLQAPRAR